MYRAYRMNAETQVRRDHGVIIRYSFLLRMGPETAPKRAVESQVPTLASVAPW